MRRGVELFVLCILACGETLPLSTDETSVDGGPNGQPQNDGAPNVNDGGGEDAAAPACDLTKPFVARKLGGDVNSAADETSMTLDDAEQQMFFASARSGVPRIYVAKRNAAGDFVSATLIADIAGDGGTVHEPFVTTRGDGNLLLFSTDRDGPPSAFDLWFSERANANEAWGAPAFVYASTTSRDEAPFLESDGTLWFSSGNGTSEADIYSAKATLQGFDPAEPVGDPISVDGAEDTSPVLTRDGLRIYFATTRRRAASSHRFEIFTATRPKRGVAFSDAKPLADLEGAFDQRPSWTSVDGCRLYFTRRAGDLDASTPGDLEAWIAERPR